MKAETSRKLRQAHRYVGLFFAPAIIFFAFSGALQTIGLHENHGAGPPAPEWIRWTASIHKDQRLLAGEPSDANIARQSGQKDSKAPPGREVQKKTRSSVPLKAFVLLMALGLILSSMLGMTIALTNRAARRPSLTALGLGTIVPVVLLLV